MSVVEPEVAEAPEMVRLLTDVCTARDIPYELLCSAVEESIATAYREHTGSSSAIARLDPETGGIELYERRRVVAVVTDELAEIALTSVSGFEEGDFFDRRLEPGSFARVAALTAKRVILQRVLEFERERVFRQYRDLEGTLVNGLVQRDVHGALYVLLDDRNEATMPPWERLPRERYAINDRIVCELQAVRKTPRGPALFLSRASERFVRLLVNDRGVIRGARDPGRLTLLLVTRFVDVASARAAIGGERIEQIAFSENPMDIMREGLPRGTQLVECPFFDGVIAVSDDPRTQDRANLVGRLAGRSVIASRPDDLSELFADLQAEAETLNAPASEIAEIDPELIAKLEQFARERGTVDPEE